MVAPTRRSARQREAADKPRYREKYEDMREQEEDEGEEEQQYRSLSPSTLDESDDEGSSASADEWKPADKERKKAKRSSRKGVRGAVSSSEEDDDDDDSKDSGNDDDELLDKVSRKKRKANNESVPQRKIRIQTKKAIGATQDRASRTAPASTVRPEEGQEEYDEDDRREAAAMWHRVREGQKVIHTESQNKVRSSSQQKQQQQQQQHRSQPENKSASQLDQWLGIEPPAWPATCAEAMINDRDSLFVGFAYTLNAPSQAEITQCLSHLTKVVQPQVVPTARLPPSMQHLATNRRGAMHDMYAWRSLALKKGRTGLGGPEDFGLEEGQEDDGERFGAKEIAKVIRMYGATDVLVVVSRWYGGTMLGPVRFRHIEECAKAALARYMVNEAMVDMRRELNELDEQIAKIRGSDELSVAPSKSSTPSKYENLDPDRAQRLILARKKQIAMLTKPRTVSQAAPQSVSGIDATTSHNAGSEDASASQIVAREREQSIFQDEETTMDDDEAALEALNEIEQQIVAAVPNIHSMTEEETINDTRTVKAESIDPLSVSEQIGVSLPVVVKKETIVEEPSEKEVARKEIEKTQVKDEQEDVDLTGWDEL